MIPTQSPNSHPSSSGLLEDEPNPTLASPFHLYKIKIFESSGLLQQPFLPEFQVVVNASYREHEINPIGKIGNRLRDATHLADELGKNAITAVAFAGNEIIGTASVRDWVPNTDGIVWNLPDHYAGLSADEILAADSAAADGSNGDSGIALCEGDFEIILVAIKPGEKYRKKGIAENLVKACEQELLKRCTPVLARAAGRPHLRIMLKVVREINGHYWLKRGFRIVGERYCPPFTWDLEKGFVLWAMSRELLVN